MDGVGLIGGAQSRQRRHDPRTFARQIPLEEPRFPEEWQDAQLQVVDRCVPTLEVLAVHCNRRQCADAMRNHKASRMRTSKAGQSCAKRRSTVLEILNRALELLDLVLNIVQSMKDRTRARVLPCQVLVRARDGCDGFVFADDRVFPLRRLRDRFR